MISKNEKGKVMSILGSLLMSSFIRGIYHNFLVLVHNPAKVYKEQKP